MKKPLVKQRRLSSHVTCCGGDDHCMLLDLHQSSAGVYQNTVSLIQQQLQLPQIPRSSSILSQNSLSQLMGQNSNLGSMNTNQMIASKSATQLQLQMLQQQQQQQNPMQRKVMMGLNSMVGLGGLGNIMGMGGLQPMSGLSGMQPNQMNMSSMSNFGTGIHPGSLTADQANAMAQKLKQVQQSRGAGVYGGIPNSMIGHTMNRANVSQMQRSLASMAPPKIPGQNFYHQQQQQMQQQHLQQQLIQQQQQQQQQQISLPMQQSQMGSPSIATSPQLSNNNDVGVNIGVGSASPQLSSQTQCSVGSITSSPMEQLQGPNKGGSA